MVNVIEARQAAENLVAATHHYLAVRRVGAQVVDHDYQLALLVNVYELVAATLRAALRDDTGAIQRLQQSLGLSLAGALGGHPSAATLRKELEAFWKVFA